MTSALFSESSRRIKLRSTLTRLDIIKSGGVRFSAWPPVTTSRRGICGSPRCHPGAVPGHGRAGSRTVVRRPCGLVVGKCTNRFRRRCTAGSALIGAVGHECGCRSVRWGGLVGRQVGEPRAGTWRHLVGSRNNARRRCGAETRRRDSDVRPARHGRSTSAGPCCGSACSARRPRHTGQPIPRGGAC